MRSVVLVERDMGMWYIQSREYAMMLLLRSYTLFLLGGPPSGPLCFFPKVFQ